MPLDRVFAAVADPTRRAMMRRLERGSATVGELAEPFDMSLPAVSKHLRVLETAGLVRRRRQGRVHRIQLDARPLADAAAWLEHYRAFWTQRLDDVAQYLNSDTREETDADPQH